MIRLAVIGCGAWGRHYITSALEARNCVVTHVAGDPSTSNVVAVPSREWRRLLDAQVDAFVVATPPRVHEEICTELLLRGRPVMVEKPVALDVDAARRIAKAATDSGAPLLVAHQHMFAPSYEALREHVCSWRRATVISRGGGDGPRRSYSALWDYGPHDVAMFLGLANGMVNVSLACRDAGAFTVHLDTARCFGAISVWNDAPPQTRRFVATDGEHTAVYDDKDAMGRLRIDGRAIDVSAERPLALAVRAFAGAAAGGARDWRFDSLFGVSVTDILARADAMTEATVQCRQP